MTTSSAQASSSSNLSSTEALAARAPAAPKWRSEMTSLLIRQRCGKEKSAGHLLASFLRSPHPSPLQCEDECCSYFHERYQAAPGCWRRRAVCLRAYASLLVPDPHPS